VASVPSNATIFIDGVQKGLTDQLVTNITAGTHTLMLAKTGYQSKTVPIDVKAGQTTILEPITLTPSGGPVGGKGAVFVSSIPSNATIFIDGVKKGMTDLLVTNLTAGTHTLKLNKTGFQDATAPFEVTANQTTVLSPITLTPGGGPAANTGSVFVASIPNNATIYLDGVKDGLTDKLLINITAGTHNLTLNKTGYQNATVQVDVKANQTTVLSPVILTPGGGPVESGSVYVASVPSNATIFLDGVQKGLTDKLLTNVSAGLHNLKLTKTGFQSTTVEIEVLAGQTTILAPITLTPSGGPVVTTGSVYVASIPSNATIFIDGVQKGVTNRMVTNITAGTHTLKLNKTGYQNKTVEIEVVAGQDKVLPPISLDLADDPVGTGSVYVASVPTNATIYIDSTVKGFTNQLVSGIPAGTHNLTLTKVGYQASTIWVEIVSGVSKILASISLSPI
jgi:hypothetical protein